MVAHASKNVLDRGELSLESNSFSSLLFSPGFQLDNKELSPPQNSENKVSLASGIKNILSEEMLVPDVINSPQKVGALSNPESQLMGLGAQNQSDAVVMIQSDREELKELHEQKLFANHSLSYIDIKNIPNRSVDIAAANSELNNVDSKARSPIVTDYHHSSSVKLQLGPLAAHPVSSSRSSIYSDELTISAAIVSQRYIHNESIEKSKVVVTRHEKSASLYIRDHFSDKKTLAAVVTDILGRLKSTINEVIINGKRG